MAPIAAADARAIVKRWHYSGSVVQNSQLHFGAFLGGRCLGAMSLGPPLDRRKVLPIVSGTPWNGMLELNRMAFSDALPPNSESRCLGVVARILRREYPHVEWILSFADATQCGDGTIYRASGFLLVGIKKNTNTHLDPAGRVLSQATFSKGKHILAGSRGGAGGARQLAALGAVRAEGFQLRYLLPLNATVRDRLTVPVLPYSTIAERGAGMYRGRARAGSIDGDAAGIQPAQGGSNPTPALTP